MKIFYWSSLIVMLSLFSCGTKEYSITTYVTSLDQRDHFNGKRFKYAYQEFNADSNLMYEELYATFDYAEKIWGQLFSKITTSYNGRLIESSVTVSGFEDSQKKETTETYAYENNTLRKKFTDGKITAEYDYDSNQRLIKEKYLGNTFLAHTNYFYNAGGLKVKQVSYLNDTLISTTNFHYNDRNKLIDVIIYDAKGNKGKHTQFIRNKNGFLLEEKWRDGYDTWRMGEDASIIHDEFYESKKYFYNKEAQLFKIVQYDLGRPSKLYEFEYR